MNDSFLQTKLQEYFSLRIALGIPLGERELPLKDFVTYLQRQLGDGAAIRAQSAIDWACMHTSHSVMTQYLRLSLVRGFLRHLKAGLPDEIEIPDLRLIARPRRPMPYVFSTVELKRLMKKAGADQPPENSIQPYTFQTILGLMACSGLRPGEIVRLKITDLSVDHNPPRLLIRSSKFKKSRWVPLHFTAYNRLIDYLEWREQLNCVNQSDSFFICKKGQPLNYQKLRLRFEELIQRIKVIPKAGQLRPTLHSLRHTFAVRRLRQWHAWRMDTAKLLPILSIYLGHKSLKSSYWYLSATPELMNAASKLFEMYARQEVCDEA